MKKRIALLLVMCLLPACALGEISWPQDPTPGQAQLADYIAAVNAHLTELSLPEINTVYECYPGFAVLGVMREGASELVPDGVEMTFTLHSDAVNTLQLRVSDPDLFAGIAAACIRAASPGMTLQEARTQPDAYVRAVKENPRRAFEDEVAALNGEAPRVYYAYYPNQYADGVNWLQLTLVFPLGGTGGAISATPTPPPAADDADTEFAGYFSQDEHTHLEVFTTPTPEPDSAAAE